MGNAIGLIETRGLVAAVEAVDVCLKAANVEFVSYKFTTGGLVCVIVSGEVGAVRAAVDAGAAAADKVGEVIAVHVIPRPAGDVVNIMDKIDGVKAGVAGTVRAGVDNLVKEKVVKEEAEKEEAREDISQEITGKKKTAQEDTEEAAPEIARERAEEDLERNIETGVGAEEEREAERGAEAETEDKENEEDSELAEKDQEYNKEILEQATDQLQLILAERKEDILEENKRIDKYNVGTLRKTLRVLSIENIDRTGISTMRKKEILDIIIDYVLQAGGEKVYDEIR